MPRFGCGRGVLSSRKTVGGRIGARALPGTCRQPGLNLLPESVFARDGKAGEVRCQESGSQAGTPSFTHDLTPSALLALSSELFGWPARRPFCYRSPGRHMLRETRFPTPCEPKFLN